MDHQIYLDTSIKEVHTIQPDQDWSEFKSDVPGLNSNIMLAQRMRTRERIPFQVIISKCLRIFSVFIYLWIQKKVKEKKCSSDFDVLMH